MNPWKVLGQLDVVPAGEYLRVSEDHSGIARSTTEQHDVLEADCEDNGWTMGPTYCDPGIGASRLSRKKRPDFDQLVGDLEAGRFEAKVLLLWTVSRGSRRVSEWVVLIELCEARSVYIWSHVHARLFDPANANDRRDLIKAAADAEAEASLSGVAIRRANAANATSGRPHGRVQWGYRRVYDPTTRQLIAQEVEEPEAEVTRELFARLRAGEGLNRIADDFQARGIRTRSGTFYSRQGLRSMALSPTYAGMRAHIPGRTGGRPKFLELDQLHQGNWPKIVEPAEWFEVQRLLHDPKRLTDQGRRPGRGKYWLTRIARCGKCGNILGSYFRDDRAYYRCLRVGCVVIAMADLDAHVEKAMRVYLGREDVIEALRARDREADDELTKVVNELGTERANHDDLTQRALAKKISWDLVEKAEPVILKRIAELERRYEELNTPTVLRGLVDTEAEDARRDIGQRLADASISAKRRVASLLLTCEWMGELRVLPGGGSRHRTVPAACRVYWGRGEGPAIAQVAMV